MIKIHLRSKRMESLPNTTQASADGRTSDGAMQSRNRQVEIDTRRRSQALICTYSRTGQGTSAATVAFYFHFLASGFSYRTSVPDLTFWSDFALFFRQGTCAGEEEGNVVVGPGSVLLCLLWFDSFGRFQCSPVAHCYRLPVRHALLPECSCHTAMCQAKLTVKGEIQEKMLWKRGGSLETALSFTLSRHLSVLKPPGRKTKERGRGEGETMDASIHDATSRW